MKKVYDSPKITIDEAQLSQCLLLPVSGGSRTGEALAPLCGHDIWDDDSEGNAKPNVSDDYDWE